MTGVVNHGILDCVDIYTFFKGSIIPTVRAVHRSSLACFKVSIVNIRTGETGGNGGNKYKSKNSSNDFLQDSSCFVKLWILQ